MKIGKKLLFSVLLLCFSATISAQDYNKWSVDFGGGINTIGSTLSPGYEASPFWQANIGVRHMFNQKFGLRLDAGYNSFSEDTNSAAFNSNYYRLSAQGVLNLGNVLNFRSWTNRINLLAHFGGGISSLTVSDPVPVNDDVIVNLMAGLTPQIKLSDRISLFADFSSIIHFFQEANFDGGPNNSFRESNISFFNTSIGLNIALGKNKQHADFYDDETMDELEKNSEIETIKSRLEKAENEIANLKVSKLEMNKENLITELDTRYIKREERLNTNVVDSNVDFIRQLLTNGYVNVFFDVNKSTIQQGSLNSVNYLKQFLVDNPYMNAILVGYADETGKVGYNQELSTKRAKTVYDLLVGTGIEADRLNYIGAGEDTTVTEGSRQFARKVTFKITQ